MPKIAGVGKSRHVCMCEGPALIAAGVARRTGLFLEITDRAGAARVAREHYNQAHAERGGPALEPMED